MRSDIKLNLIRAAFIIAFLMIFRIIWYVIAAIAIFQLVFNLIFLKANPQILVVTESIILYLIEVFQFITSITDRIPFPFNAWPKNRP